MARRYGRTSKALSQARSVLGELAEAEVSEIFEEGLHEFLTRFIRDIAAIGALVHEAYLSGEAR